MTVFYSIREDNTRQIDAIEWLTDVILSVDISYWAVPGTLEN